MMGPDYNKAAIRAAETLLQYGVKKAPVSPLPILEQLDDVLVISFSDLSESSGLCQHELIPLFGKNMDAVTSAHIDGNRTQYIVAYNSLLPFAMVQRALARELGHIILRHEGSSPENTAEAQCFAMNLLCPRPLVHAIQATGTRVTSDLIATLTGIFDYQTISALRKMPGTDVPAGLNRFVRTQFMPFMLNFFLCYRANMAADGSEAADFGTYMDNYQE